MKCPQCESTKLAVIDSRTHEDYIRRRRKCIDCLYRFTTREFIIGSPDFAGLEEISIHISNAINILTLARSKSKDISKGLI